MTYQDHFEQSLVAVRKMQLLMNHLYISGSNRLHRVMRLPAPRCSTKALLSGGTKLHDGDSGAEQQAFADADGELPSIGHQSADQRSPLHSMRSP